MGRIVGIAEAGNGVITAGTTVAILGAVGIENAIAFRGFSASVPDQIATLGPYYLVLDRMPYNAEKLSQIAGQDPN